MYQPDITVILTYIRSVLMTYCHLLKGVGVAG